MEMLSMSKTVSLKPMKSLKKFAVKKLSDKGISFIRSNFPGPQGLKDFEHVPAINKKDFRTSSSPANRRKKSNVGNP